MATEERVFHFQTYCKKLIQKPPDFYPAYRRVKACTDGPYMPVRTFTVLYGPIRAYTHLYAPRLYAG